MCLNETEHELQFCIVFIPVCPYEPVQLLPPDGVVIKDDSIDVSEKILGNNILDTVVENTTYTIYDTLPEEAILMDLSFDVIGVTEVIVEIWDENDDLVYKDIWVCITLCAMFNQLVLKEQ